MWTYRNELAQPLSRHSKKHLPIEFSGVGGSIHSRAALPKIPMMLVRLGHGTRPEQVGYRPSDF
jgi:hypothetical protein